VLDTKKIRLETSGTSAKDQPNQFERNAAPLNLQPSAHAEMCEC
jgi:hypothetical protein